MSNKNKYWNLFDSLNNSLINSGKIEISMYLEDSKNYVTGLTDGWFEFLYRLKEIEKDFSADLSSDELKKLKNLIYQLENNLE